MRRSSGGSCHPANALSPPPPTRVRPRPSLATPHASSVTRRENRWACEGSQWCLELLRNRIRLQSSQCRRCTAYTTKPPQGLLSGDDAELSLGHTGAEESLALIEQIWQDSGPFDGIMGFSQGAMLAAVVAAKSVVDPDYKAKPKCALCSSPSALALGCLLVRAIGWAGLAAGAAFGRRRRASSGFLRTHARSSLTMSRLHPRTPVRRMRELYTAALGCLWPWLLSVWVVLWFVVTVTTTMPAQVRHHLQRGVPAALRRSAGEVESGRPRRALAARAGATGRHQPAGARPEARGVLRARAGAVARGRAHGAGRQGDRGRRHPLLHPRRLHAAAGWGDDRLSLARWRMRAHTGTP